MDILSTVSLESNSKIKIKYESLVEPAGCKRA